MHDYQAGFRVADPDSDPPIGRIMIAILKPYQQCERSISQAGTCVVSGVREILADGMVKWPSDGCLSELN
jgi:hypothetical protein